MQSALRYDYLSVEDYLADEEASEVKHEYVGGSVYAMAGVTKEHNFIALYIYKAVRPHLRGGPCKTFVADVKVRLHFLGEDVFYYPDVMVGCDPLDTEPLYLRYPKLLIEVSSDSTERLDRREKRWAYQAIETLEEYMIVAQDRVEVTIFQRSNKWNGQVFTRLDETVVLNS